MTAKVLTTTHVTAMVKALRKAGTFTIDRTRTSVVAKHGDTEVLRALKHSHRVDRWLCRHVDKLFEAPQ